MTLEEGKFYIGQVKELPTLEWVSFTGGEPFLLEEQLVELVTYAAKRGLKTECVTNGFWAQSEQEARQQLHPLKAAGLDVLNLSTDTFHQEFIPAERILNGVKAALHLGIKVVLMYVAAKSSNTEDLLRTLEDERICILRPNKKPPTVADRSVLWIESGFLPVGRATVLPRSEWVLDPQASIEGGCPFVLRDISILPGGQVRACCSAGALTKALNLGTVKTQRLSTLIEGASKQPLIKLLAREGPRGLLRSIDPDRQVEPGTHVSKCHLCFTVLSDSKLQEIDLVAE